MEWTRRKAVIIYSTFLLIVFLISGMLANNKTQHVEFEVVCDNGTVERFNYSDKYICGGFDNPLRKNVIEIDIDQLLYLMKNST